jgi:hypothetical protein
MHAALGITLSDAATGARATVAAAGAAYPGKHLVPPFSSSLHPLDPRTAVKTALLKIDDTCGKKIRRP